MFQASTTDISYPGADNNTDFILQGWKNAQADQHFEKQRQVADEGSWKMHKIFYGLMQRIGDEIQAATHALSLSEPDARVLDICMAPGGYSASALKYSPHARVSGLTLPVAQGGHELVIPYGRKNARVSVRFADITMLATEIGLTAIDIPEDHPDKANFSFERMWAGELYDLVFCDGQILRTHAMHIATYRERCEAGRLMCSQLLFAMQRIKPGGTLIILLHRVEMWKTIELLNTFDQIAQIELFKPAAVHGTRGSFYLVANNVRPCETVALAAVAEWKQAWKNATFSGFAETDEGNEEIPRLLESFGERLIELGNPIWEIQKNALKKAPWFKSRATRARDEESRS